MEPTCHFPNNKPIHFSNNTRFIKSRMNPKRKHSVERPLIAQQSKRRIRKCTAVSRNRKALELRRRPPSRRPPDRCECWPLLVHRPQWGKSKKEESAAHIHALREHTYSRKPLAEAKTCSTGGHRRCLRGDDDDDDDVAVVDDHDDDDVALSLVSFLSPWNSSRLCRGDLWRIGDCCDSVLDGVWITSVAFPWYEWWVERFRFGSVGILVFC